jgi:hypothetical protein
MEAKQGHTPGPWSFSDNTNMASGKTHYTVYSNDDGYSRLVICDTPYVKNFKHHEANARLIAAAPELLEALEDVTDQMESIMRVSGFSYDGGPLNAARAAIRKATEG